jgi:hypothetical protein
MTEVRYRLHPESVPIMRAWLEADAVREESGEQRARVAAYRPHGDDAWIPEHLSVRSALFITELDDEGVERRWSFREVLHPQDCDPVDVEEQVGASFHTRRAANGLLASYLPLFEWDTRTESFARAGATLLLEHVTLANGADDYYLVSRAPEAALHAAAVAGAPLRLSPLRESHVWHLWQRASGEQA